MLQPQPSGLTRFHHSSAHHPLVVDSLQRHGLKTHLFTQAYTDTSENLCRRAYCFTLHFTSLYDAERDLLAIAKFLVRTVVAIKYSQLFLDIVGIYDFVDTRIFRGLILI